MCHEQCENSNQQYVHHSLTCSDCKQSGLEQHLKDSDFPASFTEDHFNSETGFSVTRINNHVDKITFIRVFDGNAECVGEYHDLQEVLCLEGLAIHVSE
ncbi:hypothetical protein PCCS19_21680 [Paenibacillus sp. CCS19]|nr:hypothetical protein PCCS19_21680 [Paenibacillus cellulosilyticus]